ncbi:phage antirepressor KilAC domain-containing protein [Corallococcus sp. 4LFB]|uniref:phage antirepressor KilAC domain-containing protein n=1 Tax=Corallococcus sp. 4LFB TaxID=3383249 RepID=UPI003974F3D7
MEPDEDARHLRLPVGEFFQWLPRDKVVFRESEDGPWVPYAPFREKGLLVFQARVPKRQQPGQQPKSYGQTMVTAAGVAWLSKKYGHLATPIPPAQGELLMLAGGER